MVNTIIAKTNGKDKVIDFRDCLNLANKDDYANSSFLRCGIYIKRQPSM